MNRLLPFLAAIVACQRTAKAPPEDTAAPAATPQAAAPKLDTAAAPDVPFDSAAAANANPVADADSVPWNRYPRMLANMCFGESCGTNFPAVACHEVRLRTAPSDSAPLGVTVPLNERVNVTQSDMHLEAPGVIVFRKAYVHDRENTDEGTRPATDTLRFVAGDTLYLIRYYSLGFWQAAVRGKKVDVSDGFWYADDDLPGLLGSTTRDSSIAVARSYPKISTWWQVSLKDGRRGFWKFDADGWREGLKPEGKYWEFDCKGNG